MISKGTIRFFVDTIPYEGESIVIYAASHGKHEDTGGTVFEASCPGYPPWESYYLGDAVSACKREIDMVQKITFGKLDAKKEATAVKIEKKNKPFNMLDLLSQASKGDRK